MSSNASGTRRWSLLLTILVALAGAAWELGSTPRDTALLDNDALYHLLRVERCLEHFPFVDSFDAYAHHPEGLRLHWNAPFTAALASVAACRAPAEGLGGLARALSPIPPLVGLVVALLAALAAARLAEGWGLTAAVLVVTWPELHLLFRHGAVDHHALTALGVVLMAAGGAGSGLFAWTAGALVALACAPAAPMPVGLLLAARALAAFRSRERGAWRWLLAPGAMALLAWLAHRLLETSAGPWTALEWQRLTAFQPALLLSAGSLAGALVALRAGRMRAPAAATIALVSAAAGLAVVAAAGAAAAAAGELAGHRPVVVAEQLSPLLGGPSHWGASEWTLLVLAALALADAVRSTWRGAEPAALFAAAGSAALLAAGLHEARWLSVGGAAGLALVLPSLAALLGPWTGGWRSPRLALPALSSLLAVALLLPETIERSAAEERFLTELRGLDGGALAWLRDSSPPAGPRDEAPAGEGVFVQWGLGHRVNVLAGRPTVVDPFNHVGVAEAEEAVLLAPDEERLVAELRARQVRWLWLVDEPEALLARLPDARDGAREAPQLPRSRLYLPPVAASAAVRTWLGSGFDAESSRLRPRFLSEEDAAAAFLEEDGEVVVHVVPRSQVFELVEGALISGRAPPGIRALRASVLVERPGDPPRLRRIARSVPVGEDGRFELRLALPAPGSGAGFRLPGPWRLEAGELRLDVPVTVEAVREGERIELE